MRKVAIMVCLLVLSSVARADERDELMTIIWPWGTPEALEACRTLLQKYPPTSQMAGDEESEFSYGFACMTVAHDLGENQHQYEEAMRITSAYRAVFPHATNIWAGTVDTLYLRYLLRNLPPAQQALQTAQFYAQLVQAGCRHADDGRELKIRYRELLESIMALYKHAGQPQEGIRFLQELPINRPAAIHEQGWWDLMIQTYQRLEQPEKAKQTAVWAFRMCPFTKDCVDTALQRLARALLLTGDSSEAVVFLQYLNAGQGENPLAQVPLAQLTNEQFDQMLLNTGGDFALLVDAYLYVGDFDQAVQEAQGEVVSLGNNAAAGVADIARCFKAKDMHLLRANQFLEWVKTGEGPNPLEDF